MDKRLMNPQEYVNANVNAYPSLYSGKNSTLRIMDQLFNVIGNGVDNFEHEITKTRKHKIRKPPKKFLDGSELFYVYPECNETVICGHILKTPKGDPLDEMITEEEKVKYPNRFFLSNGKIGKNDHYIPYPNFTENYSVIWWDENALSIMSTEWKAAVHEFYTSMLEFFKNEKICTKYHHAAPLHDEGDMLKRIESQERMFNAKRTDDMSDAEFHAMIEKEWRHPYDGNTREFIISRWEKEHKRIIDFILKTLERIEKAS